MGGCCNRQRLEEYQADKFQIQFPSIIDSNDSIIMDIIKQAQEQFSMIDIEFQCRNENSLTFTGFNKQILQKVVLKVMPFQDVDQKQINESSNQIQKIFQNKQPYLVQIFSCTILENDHGKFYAIQLEFCQDTLGFIIDSTKMLNNYKHQKLQYAVQLLDALNTLHQNQIQYGNLDITKVFLKNNSIKLGYLGFIPQDLNSNFLISVESQLSLSKSHRSHQDDLISVALIFIIIDNPQFYLQSFIDNEDQLYSSLIKGKIPKKLKHEYNCFLCEIVQDIIDTTINQRKTVADYISEFANHFISENIQLPQIYSKYSLKNKTIKLSKHIEEIEQKDDYKYEFQLNEKESDLTLQQNRTINAFLLNDLAKAISKCYPLYNLSLFLNFNPNINDYFLYNLVRAIKLSQKLTNLYLGLGQSNITLRGFKLLAKSILSINQLQSITLILTNNNNVEDQSFFQLSLALQNQQELNTLFLDFNYNQKCTETGISELFVCLGKIKSLRNINFGFQKSQNLNTQCVINLGQSIQQINELETLKLNFRETKNIAEKGFQVLFSSLTCFSSITSLEFDFNQSSANIENKSLELLSQSIQKQEKLEHIEFDFNNQIQWQDMSVIKSIISTKQLVAFKLLLSKSKNIINEIIIQLGEYLSQNIHLNQLELDFDCSEINESSLNTFFKFIKKNTFLDKFFIRFKCSENLGDEALQIMASTIKKLKRIESISVSFEFSENISDASFDDFLQSLKSQQLNVFQINLRNSKQLSDESLKNLIGFIQLKQSLEQISIILESSKFTEQMVQHLILNLKAIKKDKKFNIYLNSIKYQNLILSRLQGYEEFTFLSEF
ncbi:hypothetical protein TTHERM_00276030 (macronuclear) [Tetrahymena thermophila SB210]|uniref:Protein kinase domain-containing protein n=1 Tax=Tetrahymena thermophila (strain SB210) TaxID=312017 RepID=I7M1A2_TETTS|nr:hypothetical protein TTHERM_00276030 [Tetrahymena thermophila SB210]EAR95788.2 hypothetical protein TTHERM_00276030 [Tetrahymena thermophila SB210]|eukprot:XP_001016033.2 hypothetical protein TTHERM_00276030 [Tetrahymena thermophila SB210]